MMSATPTQSSWCSELSKFSKDVFWPTASGALIGGPAGGVAALSVSSAIYLVKGRLENCKPDFQSNTCFKLAYHLSNMILPALVSFHSDPMACVPQIIGKNCHFIQGVKAVVPYVVGNGAGSLAEFLLRPDPDETSSKTYYGHKCDYAISQGVRISAGAYFAFMAYIVDSVPPPPNSMVRELRCST